MALSSAAAAVSFDGTETASSPEREFAFSEADFRMLAQFAHEKAGIALSGAKRNLVYGRLSRRLRALNLRTFADYRAVLVSDQNEVQRFINAISTNLTKFFREAHHFKHFRTAVAMPFAEAAKRDRTARLRVWSAGCSTGEEAYSIAGVLRQEIADAVSLDVKILATDVDTDVLATAARGVYPAEAIGDVPPVYRGMFCQKRSGEEHGFVGDDIRDLVHFRRLNLIGEWPFKGRFDAIFCRNVMIYFDAPTKARLLQRLAERLTPQGWLYIGHSESLTRAHPLLELEGRTIYRRRA